uniref:Beta-insect toxin AaBTxL1 n=1 Tax=Androctonus australis TaxID=6858 RepID=TXA25_ANDAU|nr:RecName: Full=Beta-insect toxin AaBTxL1; AltName: Full=Neurotoxin AaBTX-L1; AltName: Full=Peptide AaF1CA25; Flags: Precursor [Androctonus australis]CAH03780.1 toxin-like peptide AaF1CA25 [Androctonus australis]
MMKLVLFSVIVILFSLIGSIHGADVPGNYPLDRSGKKYPCTITWKKNPSCIQICKKHGVKYGYCFDFQCWCEIFGRLKTFKI